MRGLLIRIGADQSEGGGHWNGPVDARTGAFTYVPIPETKSIHPELAKPYDLVQPALRRMGVELPAHLVGLNMHLDPDFQHLTYGDQGERANQIRRKLGRGDFIVFYAGLRDTRPAPQLVYAIVGFFMLESVVSACTVPRRRWKENAHTRRVLPEGATDIVVRAQAGNSGRLSRYLPIGAYRDRAYRVRPALLHAWGGLSVRDGYLQRSARLPEFLDADRFHSWFTDQRVPLITANN